MSSVSPLPRRELTSVEINEEDENSGHQLMVRPLLEVMEEMKAKLRLIDGETKSFYENSFRYLREARGQAQKLRSQNTEMRRKIAEHESALLLDHELNAKQNPRMFGVQQTASGVIEKFDELVARKMNQLNLLKHQTRVRTERLRDLETQASLLQLQLEQQEQTKQGDGPSMQAIRLLENKIEKVLLKYNETLHIGETYAAIHDKMKQESYTYIATTEALKVEIERCARKLAELKPIYEDARLVRDKTKTELQRHEELLYAHRKKRELELGSLKRLVDANREKPVPQKSTMIDQELQKLNVDMIDEEVEEEAPQEPQNRLAYCTSLHEQLKGVTGFSELSEVVARFEEQRETYMQLDKLRVQNDHQLRHLRNKMKKLKEEFAEVRKSFAHKKDKQELAQDEQQKVSDELRNRLNHLTEQLQQTEKYAAQVHVAVEHLYNKLYMVRIASKRERSHSTLAVKEMPVSMSIVELLERCSELQSQLETDLEDYDLTDEQDRMDDATSESLRTRDEYRLTVDRRLPSHASRIDRLLKAARTDESDGGDQEVLTSEVIKQRSKMIVEHAKRRVLRGDRHRN